MSKMEKPGYLALYESGEFVEQADRAFALLTSCTVCPHECRVDPPAPGGGVLQD